MDETPEPLSQLSPKVIDALDVGWKAQKIFQGVCRELEGTSVVRALKAKKSLFIRSKGLTGYEARREALLDCSDQFPEIIPAMEKAHHVLWGKEKKKEKTPDLKVVESEPMNEDAWSALRAAAEGKTCNMKRVLEWVFENIGNEVGDIDAETAPSPGAVNLLKHTLETEGGVNEFYKTMVPKIMPTKTEMEENLRMEDDGSDVTRLIDKLTKESDPVAREDVFSEAQMGKEDEWQSSTQGSDA